MVDRRGVKASGVAFNITLFSVNRKFFCIEAGAVCISNF